jgi:hypothetical protein
VFTALVYPDPCGTEKEAARTLFGAAWADRTWLVVLTEGEAIALAQAAGLNAGPYGNLPSTEALLARLRELDPAAVDIVKRDAYADGKAFSEADVKRLCTERDEALRNKNFEHGLHVWLANTLGVAPGLTQDELIDLATGRFGKLAPVAVAVEVAPALERTAGPWELEPPNGFARFDPDGRPVVRLIPYDSMFCGALVTGWRWEVTGWGWEDEAGRGGSATGANAFEAARDGADSFFTLGGWTFTAGSSS